MNSDVSWLSLPDLPVRSVAYSKVGLALIAGPSVVPGAFDAGLTCISTLRIGGSDAALIDLKSDIGLGYCPFLQTINSRLQALRSAVVQRPSGYWVSVQDRLKREVKLNVRLQFVT